MALPRYILFSLMLFSAFVRAEGVGNSSRSKLGFDIGSYKTNLHSDFGWRGGIRAAKFLGDSQMFYGIAGFYGSQQGNSPADEYMYFGGFMIGGEGKLGKNLVFEASLTAGYAAGVMRQNDIDEKSYFAVEPSLAAGFRLGEGWKILLAANYLNAHAADNLSGFTLGFRIEFKTQTTIKPLKE